MALPPPLVLLVLLLLPPPGAAEPEEDEAEAEAGGALLSCLAPAPSLAWYLDAAGPSNGSSSPAEPASGTEGSFVGAARRDLDRRLNCSALDPASGRSASASVVLHVQFEPEVVRVEARGGGGEAGQPGLLLVLFVLVQARPPASITWVGPDGSLMVNATHFLIVDAHTYPWGANRSLDLQLRAWSHATGAPLLNASLLLLPGLLHRRIQLPLLALLIGAAVALGLLTGLGVLISYLGFQKGKKAAGLALPAQPPPSDSSHLKLQAPRLPRANMSLPSNLQLNDLTLHPQAERVEAEEGALSEPEHSLASASRGLSHFPMVGYIYRASSGSSEEIWL